MVAVNPSIIVDPLLNNVITNDSLNTSNDLFHNIIVQIKKGEALEPYRFSFVVIRDITKVHIDLTESLQASNKRFIVSQGSYTAPEIGLICKKALPKEFEDVEIKVKRDERKVLKQSIPEFDTKRLKDVLPSFKFTEMERTLSDT